MVSITTYGSVVVELVRGFMVKLAEEKSHIGVGWEVGVYIRVCLGFNFEGPFYNKAHTKCEAKVLRWPSGSKTNNTLASWSRPWQVISKSVLPVVASTRVG